MAVLKTINFQDYQAYYRLEDMAQLISLFELSKHGCQCQKDDKYKGSALTYIFGTI